MTQRPLPMFLRGQDAATVQAMMDTVTPAQREQIVKRLTVGGNVQGTTSVEEALRVARADFTVEKFPTMAVLGEGQAIEVPGEAATVATWPDGRRAAFSSVGAGYHVVQNAEAFSPAQVLMDRGEFQPLSLWTAKGGAHVGLEGLLGATVAGTLADGRPDVMAHLARFETAHDGTRSTMAALYTYRLVCLNGMTALEQSGRVMIKHTTRASERIAEAARVLYKLQEAAVEEVALYAKLAERSMGRKAFAAFAQALLDEVRGQLADEAKEHAKARREAEVQELLREFANPELGTFGATAADAYNAVTAWLTPRQERYQDAVQHARALASSREGHDSRVRHRAQRLLLARTHR